jgi:hypothetical protein
MVSKFLELPQAIESYVKNGDLIAMEGFTHLIPFAAGHEMAVLRNLFSLGAEIPALVRYIASEMPIKMAGQIRLKLKSTHTLV